MKIDLDDFEKQWESEKMDREEKWKREARKQNIKMAIAFFVLVTGIAFMSVITVTKIQDVGLKSITESIWYGRDK